MPAGGGQLDQPGSPASPPPPPPGSRQGWLSPPPDIQFPPINPDAADDPWASWYGKPRGPREESPSATLPRVTPPPGGRPSQQYDAPGYGDGTGYVPAPPYVGPQQASGQWGGGPQQYDGPGDQFGGGPGTSAPQYNSAAQYNGATQYIDSGQSYGPGPGFGSTQQFNDAQQYPGQPAGNGFGGGAYNGPADSGLAAGGQPYTGAMPYPGDPQQYGPGPGGSVPPRRRGPLIPILAAGAVAVIVIVALVLANSPHGSPGTSASSGTAGTATAAPSSGTGEQSAATQLNTLLAQSGKYRAEVNAALGNVLACKSLRPARDAFGVSATNRRSLLAKLGTLPGRSALPAALLQDLTTAWQASIQVDSDFHAWAQDEISGGCNPKQVTSDANYQASNQYEGPASGNKAKFAQAWKPIAAKYGLPEYTEFQL